MAVCNMYEIYGCGVKKRLIIAVLLFVKLIGGHQVLQNHDVFDVIIFITIINYYQSMSDHKVNSIPSASGVDSDSCSLCPLE